MINGAFEAEQLDPAAVLGAVFVSHPPLLARSHHGAASGRLLLHHKEAVHQSNDSTFIRVKEVAILFRRDLCHDAPSPGLAQPNAAQLVTCAEPFFSGAAVPIQRCSTMPDHLSFLSAQFGAFVAPDTAAPS